MRKNYQSKALVGGCPTPYDMLAGLGASEKAKSVGRKG